MQIAFYSVTGQVRRFVQKLGMPSIEVTSDCVISEPFLLIIPTYDSNMLEPVFDFLEDPTNQENCRGIVGSGNRNFADLFIFTAKDLSNEYGIPIVHAFEFSGTDQDVETIKKVVKSLEP
ncbi:MAG: class Ib ribonucleoside-diphosphate reductase assembly flavoprotein NrdI [Streptococcaceae bacterium]|jgi:protein involved in ribonucleotide reduction|nr:class Ib ribonucleoside-diphosphate reductase assembly flavoprotein NrdI [Streptococcaceae bacterium]